MTADKPHFVNLEDDAGNRHRCALCGRWLNDCIQCGQLFCFDCAEDPEFGLITCPTCGTEQ